MQRNMCLLYSIHQALLKLTTVCGKILEWEKLANLANRKRLPILVIHMYICMHVCTCHSKTASSKQTWTALYFCVNPVFMFVWVMVNHLISLWPRQYFHGEIWNHILASSFWGGSFAVCNVWICIKTHWQQQDH